MKPPAHPGVPVRPVALFVMGYARSGTSALTRVLSLCGATLPPRLLGATKRDPAGFWEPRVAVHLNGAFLRRYGSAGFDPTLRLQEEGAFDADDEAAFVAQVRAFFTKLPTTSLVVIKDPKITVLSGMWFEAARQAGFDPMAVIALRHPQESINSTTAAAGTSQELGGALWLKYSLLAERQTRGLPRVVVEYANLMDDWRKEIKRISTALSIDLHAADEKTVEQFLAPGLRRNRYSGEVAEFSGADWLSTVYETMSAAARDEHWDQSSLDRVFDAYRASERGFRTVFEDFIRLRQLYRLLPIPILKLIIEADAIAHRRRGTWA